METSQPSGTSARLRSVRQPRSSTPSTANQRNRKEAATASSTGKQSGRAAKSASASDQVDFAADQPSPEERAARGKAARAKAPLESHADFQPRKSRDPVALLLSQAKTRVPELVPIRHGRMLVSPFTFYRGAALVMAADLDTTPTPGLQTQLCGDAHLSNFGAYASPERRLVFDINDFDETLPGPFEWDVKRLAASFVIAGRDNGFTKKQSRRATLAAVESYRTAMQGFAPSRSSPSGMRASTSKKPWPNTNPRSRLES